MEGNSMRWCVLIIILFCILLNGCAGEPLPSGDEIIAKLNKALSEKGPELSRAMKTPLSKLAELRIDAEEAETKGNVFEIQCALEDYAKDHGEYPEAIYGGDKSGWKYFNSHLPEGAAKITDPLLEGNYLESYPVNAFIVMNNAGDYDIPDYGAATQMACGIFMEAIRGPSGKSMDPRFGLKGNKMGNVLSEPYLFIGPGNSDNPERLRLCPGQFGYAQSGEPFPPDAWKGKNVTLNSPDDSTMTKPVRYLLYGFGSMVTEGMDLLRFTGLNEEVPPSFPYIYKGQYYEVPHLLKPDTDIKVNLRIPETFGGGSGGTLPVGPPWIEDDEFLYGAPDGYKDGVIIVLVQRADWSGLNRNPDWEYIDLQAS